MKSAAARVTTAAEGLPRRRFTVAEVEAMVAAGVMEEDERVELIGGELVPMSPKGNHHEVVKIALPTVGIGCRGRHRSRQRPPSGLATIPISNRTSWYFRARWNPRPQSPMCCSSSKSPNSSRRYDMGRKAALYASFGIRDLWVIDAVKLTARVFRQPGAGGYRETLDFGPGDLLAPRSPDLFGGGARRTRD